MADNQIVVNLNEDIVANDYRADVGWPLGDQPEREPQVVADFEPAQQRFADRAFERERARQQERAVELQRALNRRAEQAAILAVAAPTSAKPGSQTLVEVTADGVKLVRSDILAKMTIETFIERFIHESDPQFDGLLPAGTKIVDRQGDLVRFLVELEPSIQSIRMANNKIRYQIGMPWQYFYFVFRRKSPKGGIAWSFENARVYWSRNRMATNNPDNYFLVARLPNIYQRTTDKVTAGQICFGNTAPDSTLPLHERIEAVINDFFSAEAVFNGDLGWNFPNGYAHFRDWAADTKSNPFSYLNWRDWEGGDIVYANLGELFPPHHAVKGGSFNELAYAIQKQGGASF